MAVALPSSVCYGDAHALRLQQGAPEPVLEPWSLECRLGGCDPGCVSVCWLSVSVRACVPVCV